MSRPFERPIIIQKINEKTEEWENVYNLHARINKTKSDSEFLSSGAIQNKHALVFEVRYFSDLKQIRLNAQCYRVLYDGVPYNITDYDDFMETHKTVKLLGESY